MLGVLCYGTSRHISATMSAECSSGVAKLYHLAACTCRLVKHLEAWKNGYLYQYFVGTCLANSCITQVDALEKAIDRQVKQWTFDP